MTTAPAQTSVRRSQLPRLQDVLREQLRAIGVALRVPMLIAVGFAVLATITLAIQIASGDKAWNLLAEPSALPGGIGALLAIAVWAREERFGAGFMWTLPVDRARHALIRVFAGWLWLMGGVGLYSLCVLVLALVTGGGTLPVETLNVLTTELQRTVRVDAATLRVVQWTPGLLIWVVPFGAATAIYTIGSAFMLGARRPLLWAVGALLLVPVSSFAGHLANRRLGISWLADAPMLFLDSRYGLDALLKLRTWTLDRRALLTTGETVEVWSAVPSLADWPTAFLLWTSVGLLALLAAVARHREGRRA